MKPSLKSLYSAGLLALILFTLPGCGKSVSGTYTSPVMSINFKDGGKATVTILNSDVEASDTVNGDKVTVTPASGDTSPITFTIDANGNLTAPDGTTLKKQ
jgi:hypothetical protein